MRHATPLRTNVLTPPTSLCWSGFTAYSAIDPAPPETLSSSPRPYPVPCTTHLYPATSYTTLLHLATPCTTLLCSPHLPFTRYCNILVNNRLTNLWMGRNSHPTHTTHKPYFAIPNSLLHILDIIVNTTHCCLMKIGFHIQILLFRVRHLSIEGLHRWLSISVEPGESKEKSTIPSWVKPVRISHPPVHLVTHKKQLRISNNGIRKKTWIALSMTEWLPLHHFEYDNTTDTKKILSEHTYVHNTDAGTSNFIEQKNSRFERTQKKQQIVTLNFF